MKLKCIEGKNFRNYIHISDLKTKQDLDNLELLRSVVTRTEFKPFIRSFNKNVTQSFLFNDSFIPAQFIQEITNKGLPAFTGIKPVIENTDILFNHQLKREDFFDWLDSLELPSFIDMYNPKYEYQPESVFRALLFKVARVEIPTGGGKTLITYLWTKYLLENILNKTINNRGKKVLIIVPRTDLCVQTRDAFIDEYDSLVPENKKLKVDTIYANAKRQTDANVVIGNWQSIKNYDEDFFTDFGAILVDEVHSAKIYSINKEIVGKCKTVEYWFGMTATYPEEKTLDFLNIVSMFGPNVLVRKTSELTDDNVVVPAKIWQIKIHYDKDKNFSKNLIESGIVGTEKYRVEKTWFQTNSKRNDVILDCISKLDGNHVILVESVEYVIHLMELCKQHFPDKQVFKIHGIVNQKDREEIKSIIKQSDNCILCCTYETMSTGVNIPNIHAVHFPAGGRSRVRIKQSVGRGLRLHPSKEFLDGFDYQDEMMKSSFRNHWKERNTLYKVEGHKIDKVFDYHI